MNLQRLFIFLTVVLFSLTSFASEQQGEKTVIKGVVVDSVSKKELSSVIIIVKDSKITAQSDVNGIFSITVDNTVKSDSVRFTTLGYADKSVKFLRGKVNILKVELRSFDYSIEGVEVSASRVKYKKKGNPAVELIEKLIARNSLTDPKKIYGQYGYQRYEKMTASMHDFAGNFKNKKLAFLNQIRDTNDITGKPSLPFSIRERIVEAHVKGRTKTEQVIAHRNEGIDERFSQENIDVYLSMLREEIDIFQPSIYFLMRNFVSPFSPIGPNYYKYFLANDTIDYDGARCVQLSFSPFDRNTPSFAGRIYVTADSTLFVRGVELTFPNSLNLNFAYNLSINQNFRQGDKGERLITRDDVYYQVMIFSEKDPIGLDMRHINTFSNYTFEQEPVKYEEQGVADAKYWTEHRHIPITPQEENVKTIANELRRIPLYRITEALGIFLSEEYLHTGKKSLFDIGPYRYFIGNNILEGYRVALGGVTTPKLSPNLFFEGYGAYGFTDRKFKWNTAIEYSFIKKSKYFKEYPVHSIRAQYVYDVTQLGNEAGMFTRDNLLSLLNRRADSSLTYMRMYQIRYTREFKNKFSFFVAGRHYIQYESDLLILNPDNLLHQTSMTEFKARLRYAPGEKLLQNGDWRYSTDPKAPIFELSHTVAFKGLLWGEYNRNLTEFRFFKRFNLSPVGYVDTEIKAGKEWNEVPYIFLRQAMTNSSYFLKKGAFSLMLPVEFMYDQFAQWDVTWYLNGYVLNKIPLIKHLKLREVLTTKGLYGNLTDKNNPQCNLSAFPFPQGSSAMGRQPYVEVGVGVENILKFFRVDYVRRMTYQGRPGVSDWGILFSIEAKF